MARVCIISGRRRRPRRSKSVKFLYFIFLIIFLTIIYRMYFANVTPNGSLLPKKEHAAVLDLDKLRAYIILSDSTWKYALEAGLPAINSTFNSPSSGRNAKEIMQEAVLNFTRADLENPKRLIASQMGFILKDKEFYGEKDGAETGLKETSNIDENKFKEMEEPNTKSGENIPVPETQEAFVFGNRPLVGIYHTHGSETFIPTHGKARMDDGSSGGVVKVAQTLAGTLEKKHGIKTVYAPDIHDYPSFELSYSRSAETAKEMLKKHPGIQILIDVHRDAGVPDREVVKIDGENAARILIIIGNNSRLAHPHWQQNYQFARKAASIMEETYPGLLRETRVKNGRYNQHLHPHALLVEIGNTNNSLEEAQNAAKLLADVLAKLIKEDMASSKI